MRSRISTMATRLFMSLVALGTMTLVGAEAAETPFPHRYVCERNGEIVGGPLAVSPRLLMRWLMSTNLVSDLAKDYDNNGDITYSDKVNAAVDVEYCDVFEDQCVGNDAPVFDKLREVVKGYFSQKKPLEHYTFVKPVGFQSGPVTTTTGRSLKPPLADFYRFVSGDPGAYQILCKIKVDGRPKTTAGAPVSDNEEGTTTDVAHQEADIKRERPKFDFRLRGDIADLSKKLTKKNTKKISAATASLVVNEEAGSKEYQISGVAGFHAADWTVRDGKGVIDLTPFVKIDRRFSSDPDAEEVDNLGVGLNFTLLTELGSWTHQLDLFPLYTSDSEASTSIGSLNAIWTPAFDIGNVTAINVGRRVGAWYIIPTLRGLVHVGQVFDDGGNPELKEDQEFVRVGADFGLVIQPVTGTFLDNFSLVGKQKYLYGAEGDPRRSDRTELGIVYYFPDLQNFQIDLKYVNGEADETFEKLDFWEARIGVKY